jgi:hypothetical protein
MTCIRIQNKSHWIDNCFGKWFELTKKVLCINATIANIILKIYTSLIHSQNKLHYLSVFQFGWGVV